MRDIDIRKTINEQEFRAHKQDPDTRILQELGICLGETIVDIAVINGSMQAYEIKSDRDTLNRLPKQIENYNKIFDYIHIVTTKTHLKEVRKLVSEWWGILEVLEFNGKILIEQIRAPKLNKNINKISLLQLLWKEECIDIIKNKSLDLSKKNKPKRLIWEYLIENIEIDELKNIVRQYLKQRINWKVN